MGDVAKGIKSFKKGMSSDVTEDSQSQNITDTNQNTDKTDKTDTNQDIDKKE